MAERAKDQQNRQDQSHPNAGIEALVKFLARRAAERDYERQQRKADFSRKGQNP